jgi:uncharacterized protein YkwD
MQLVNGLMKSCLKFKEMKRPCFEKTANKHEENHANSIRPLKINCFRMKKGYKLVCLIAFAAFIQGNALSLRAQNYRDKPIDADHFDANLMEYFVKIKIDSVRMAHGLSALQNDSLLYLAALDQARYQKGKKELTHFQSGSRKKTLKDRLEYYKFPFTAAAENLARGYVLVPIYASNSKSKTIVVKTYEQAAFQMVDGWVHSKGHYQNIITPGYRYTGVAIVYDQVKKEVNGAQVFADAPESYRPVKRIKAP